MFVLCQHCQFLVALDPVSGETPSRCPRCAGRLRPDSDADADADAVVPAPASEEQLEPVVDTEPDTDRTATSDPIADEPTAADHDDAGSAEITDQALADDVGTEAALTDKPTAAGSVNTELDAVELDAVESDPFLPDALEPDVAEPDTAEPDAIEPPSTHASAETDPVDSPDADPAVDGEVLATSEDAIDQDPGIIETQHFDPVEDAEAPATEPADGLIEAMLGPAAIEIEAATVTSGEVASGPLYEPPIGVPYSSGNSEETAPGLVVEDPEPPFEPAADPTPAPAPETEELPASAPVPSASIARIPAPSFVRRPPAVSGVASRRRWLTAVAIALLTLILLLQLMLADRARLAADARWRPAISMLCGALRCTLPPWREPAAITLLRRGVRPHPTLRGALRVTATFRNDARWAQPWPGVVLTLSDVDGRAVAARTFLPRDYLDAKAAGAAATQSTIASGHSKTIMLDIVEPSPRIVAFTFDFQ